MQTIMKNETERREEHCRCVLDISRALDQLADSLTAEKDCRRAIQLSDADLHANLPSLKFPIVLSTNKNKPFDFITKWRQDVTARGLLKEEGE